MNRALKKSTLVFLIIGLVFPFSNRTFAGVSDIKYMNRDFNGFFDVICTDGDTEKVSAQEVLNNSVCKTNRDPLASRQIICTGNQFLDQFYITRISDGEELGDKMPFQVCQKILKSSVDGLICTGNQFLNQFYVTRISDGEQLGGRMPLQVCQKILKSSVDGLICTGNQFLNQFYVTRISDGEQLGGRISLDKCLQTLKA